MPRTGEVPLRFRRAATPVSFSAPMSSIPRCLIPAGLLSLVAVVASSCTSTTKTTRSGGSSQDGSRLSSRLMSKPSLDKRSMFDSKEESGDKKPFLTSIFGGKKEYAKKPFQGMEEYKVSNFKQRDTRSPWAGMTAREFAEKVSPSHSQTYETSTSRMSGQMARESGGSGYRTGNYKTGENRMGTRGLQNAKPPKIIQNPNTQGGMSQSDIQELLNKD